jgi:hypothetical protein
MSIKKRILTAASIALLPLAASAASIIVPAAGSGPGANGSQWRSELTLHNASAHTVTASLIYHDGNGASAPASATVAGRATTSIADVVLSKFGVTGTGAIEIVIDDADAPKVTVTSRTSNFSDHGEFGQDIPAIAATDAAGTGDLTVLSAPSSSANYRFNFGLYAEQDSTVHWELLRADGSLAATKDVSYPAGTQTQYNTGIATLFALGAQDNDAVQATMTKGAAIFYGSAINNLSGDPTFVPGLRTREDIRINFVGVDINQDGKAELLDADHDGVLDQPVDIFSIGFPTYLRIIATGENGEPVTFELLDSPRDAMLMDASGTIAYAAGGDVKGTKTALKVRATAGANSAILTIPVNIR